LAAYVVREVSYPVMLLVGQDRMACGTDRGAGVGASAFKND